MNMETEYMLKSLLGQSGKGRFVQSEQMDSNLEISSILYLNKMQEKMKDFMKHKSVRETICKSF